MSVTITIAGVDRTSSVVFGSFRRIDNINQQVDTLQFTVNKYGSSSFAPAVNSEVVVTNGATTVFGGVIIRVTEEQDGAHVLNYAVECADYSQYLKRKLVTERYTNMTAAAIISDIITDYASDFTVVNVATGPTIKSISFSRLTVAQSLQKIADAIGYVWYVDYKKDIHFFAKTTELSPVNISDTSGNYIYNSLNITEDLTQLRNKITVQGGDAISSATRTETFTGDATKVQFALANKFSETPVVVVGGVTKTVGTEYLSDDASFQCQWNFNEKYIRFTAGNTPGSGASITVTAKYRYPIVVSVPSAASIAEFGTYEFAITDKTILSQQEAIDRGYAELVSYQNELHDGSFRTYEDGIRSGQTLTINSTLRNKSITVVVQSVTMVMRDPLGTSFEYNVRFATLKNVGIIEFLQRQLRANDIIVDADDTLLNLYPFTDSAATSDSIATPTFTTGPYKYGADANAAICGYSTYE